MTRQEKRAIALIGFIAAVVMFSGGFLAGKYGAVRLAAVPKPKAVSPVVDKPKPPVSIGILGVPASNDWVSIEKLREQGALPAPAATEDAAAAALPPAEPVPPPVPHADIMDKNSQGFRRYDFMPNIGDIGRIVYHRETGALLMATVEPDGMRSIWKLSANGNLKRALQTNNQPGDIFLAQDSRGRIYSQFDNPGILYRSEDAGENWRSVTKEIDGTFWTLADDGGGKLWATQHAYNQAILYRSTDDGRTWQKWRDFQRIFPEEAVAYAAGDDRFRLRHLHAVAYVNGRLFVGVGEVARFTVMSDDGGETWKKVWDEGFTAYVTLSDNSGLLFGPDRLRAHGIARYDFESGKTVEVWSPIPYGYAGYTYSMLRAGGIYYAAFHTEANDAADVTSKLGIISSPDAKRWFPFFEAGPFTQWARTDTFLENGPKAGEVFLSMNGMLYSFDSLDKWSYDLLKPFGGK